MREHNALRGGTTKPKTEIREMNAPHYEVQTSTPNGWQKVTIVLLPDGTYFLDDTSGG
jgi:hypothetical protein